MRTVSTLALIIGVCALALAFFPIINNFAFALALIALLLGSIGWVGTRRSGPSMAIVAVIVALLAAGGVLWSQWWYAKTVQEFGDALSGQHQQAVPR